MATTQAGHIAVGAAISRIRDAAGITQAALAKRLPMSAPTISRIEKGEVELPGDELNSLLDAIGTDAAREFKAFLAQEWRHLQRPAFHHPSRQDLWRAERILQAIEQLKTPDAKAAFIKQVEFYEAEVRAAAHFLLDLTHDLAFIGSIGVGKSTTICSLTDLRLPDEKTLTQKMVLEAGGGGTTICEVQITRGPQFGLIVQSLSEAAIRQDVADFAEYLMRARGTDEKMGAVEDGIGVSRELERAIRNMAGLAVVSHREESGKRTKNDPARDLAACASSAADLAIEILSRMKLPRRDGRTLWYSATESDPPLRWLQRMFAEINNGRHSDFSIPERIEVVVPGPVLAHPHYSLRIIDTRGVDQTSQRADIECHFDNPRTLIVLCSRFMDAPEQTVQMLLERSRAAGVSGVESRSVVLVLARPNEAASMKDHAGPVADDEEGYDVKRDQIVSALSRIGLPGVSVSFFNAMYDDFAPTRESIIGMIDRIRDRQARRISSLSSTIERLVQNKEQEEAHAVFNEAMRRVLVWLDKNGDLGELTDAIQQQLVSTIRSTHARSVWASTRRKGAYPNLDYYYQLGRGARIAAAKHVQDRVTALKAIITNLVDDDRLSPAHDFLREISGRVNSEADEMFQHLQVAGSSAFEQPLSDDVEFWKACEDRWGQGGGYRDDIASKSDHWFENETAQNERRVIVQLIVDGWTGLVFRMRQLINEVSTQHATLA
jgi:transcriptional regulator with XRE-family HTH domain